jgi:hypothetical protein
VLPFSLPTVSIVTPADGATYTQGQAITADFTCTAAAGATLKPGTAGCAGPVANGGTVDTSILGSHIFTVTATDTDGPIGTATSSYTVTPKTTGIEPAPETPPSSTIHTTSTTATTSTTSTSTSSTGPSAGVASTPKAVEELLQGCSKSQLVLNDAYIHGGRVLLSGSAAKSLVGKKVKIECGKTTIAKTFTPPASGRFHIALAVPANARAGIFTLKSKVAANKHATAHGFTTYSLPLPVALG